MSLKSSLIVRHQLILMLITVSFPQKVDPQTAQAIDEFLIKLRACATGKSHFSFILDDPAGNSFIENP